MRCTVAKALEKKHEDDFVNYALYEFNILALKMEIRGRRNYPDRQVLCGDGYIFFIEFKREGEKPNKGQLSRHKKLRARGYRVYVCDNLQSAKDALHIEILGL